MLKWCYLYPILLTKIIVVFLIKVVIIFVHDTYFLVGTIASLGLIRIQTAIVTNILYLIIFLASNYFRYFGLILFLLL
jgi:hypothetical protein